MTGPERELSLDRLPRPPLYRLVDGEGRDVFAETEVGSEPSRKVGVLFSSMELAREFSGEAAEHGMDALAGLEPRELGGWGSVEVFAVAGEDYVLVISEGGTGLFHAGDVAARVAEASEELPFPLYLISDARGEAPLITVETGEAEASEAGAAEEVLVAALFSSPEKARFFRERAAHLNLPDGLGTIEDAEGLRRHALVARQAGAGYAVIDPGPGESDAIPIEDLIQ